MAPADDVEAAAKASPLWAKYGERADRESARERLEARVEQAARPREEPAPERPKPKRSRSRRRPAEPEKSGDPITDFLTSREGQRLGREIVRGVFGMLRKRL
jgi:hypothetical protein